MKLLHIIKIGGNIVNDEEKLDEFLTKFVRLAEPKILVHGGGSSASDLCEKLGILIQMNNGRRITDEPTLNVAVMVYAGLINKKIVAKLQGSSCNALGLSGADLNTIPAKKRTGTEIDYGFAGDIESEFVNTYFIKRLLDEQIVPVFPAITHDNKGQLLNTNADTIASTLAIAFSGHYTVSLTYCFERKGVLKNIEDSDSWIPQLNKQKYMALKDEGIIHAGMIPKLDAAFGALKEDVEQVHIKHAEHLLNDRGTELSL